MTHKTGKASLGIIGHAVVDEIFPGARYEIVGDRVIRIFIADKQFDVPLLEPLHFCKVSAEVPEAMWRHTDHRQCGGGGPNSLVAAAESAPDLSIRYVESTKLDPIVVDYHRLPNVAVRSLDLRQLTRNAVLAGGSDKLILRSVLPATVAKMSEVVSKLAWVCDCKWLLVNSPKDQVVFESLTEIAIKRRIPVCLVVTKFPDVQFVRKQLLPEVRAIIGSADEIPTVMGWDCDQSFAGATRLVARLQECAPLAAVFVTLGEDGVLVAEPGSRTYWVRMNEEVRQMAQVQVALDTTCLCGVGDAFSGGVASYLASPEPSILRRDSLMFESEVVAAAAAGTQVAVRWFGFDRDLVPSDFRVSSVSEITKMAVCA